MNTEPNTVRAGDDVSWRRSLPDYLPADGWALKYRLLWQAPPSVQINAAADGDGHLVALAGTSTAAWQSGRCTLIGWVEKAGSRVTLLQTTFEVLPDLTAAASLDGRSAARRRLDDAEAALSAYLRAGQGHVAEYQIAGRKMVFRSAKELREIVAAARADVARENALAAAAQGVAAGRVYTRF